MALGRDLGLSERESRDTRGRLRDTFEAIDYLELNTVQTKFNTYNIIMDKRSITGSNCWIVGHPSFSIVGSSVVGSEDYNTYTRIIENRIWNLWEEDFTTTGSKGAETTVDWTTTGSIEIGSGQYAYSTNLSYDLVLATIDKVKYTIIGSYINNLVVEATADDSTWTQISNVWGEIEGTGSTVRWRAYDPTGSSIIYNLKLEWKSNDL